MNKEQKLFLARVVEISAFAIFGAVGYSAYQENNWLELFLSSMLFFLMVLVVYNILSIDVKERSK
ncbi:MAG: hypothetical protein IBX55_16975 [Methyloprofundus sp.]|nr:hypothetical protein [Methyloprofundus sp.]